MSGTSATRSFERSLHTWVRQVHRMTTGGRPEFELGSVGGRGVLWAWHVERRRVARCLGLGGLAVLAALVAAMVAERLAGAAAPGLGVGLRWGAGALALAGVVSVLLGLRLQTIDRIDVAVVFDAGRKVNETRIRRLERLMSETRPPGVRPGRHGRWLVSRHGFTSRGLHAARAAGYRCFVAVGAGFVEVCPPAHVSSANDDGERPLPTAA